ncbi:MAG: prolipoprotein diacylglyceryl transferase [Betaproteobacteria bacterium]|nr:prolipoprotein diacylglyceryl transferase [Betaproteobacteria bacterium]
MRPILFEIFGWEVPSWHFFFVLAALVAYFCARTCAQSAARAEHPAAQPFLHALPNIFVICYIAGWFGARALSIVVEQLEVRTLADFLVALFQIGPMTFYGGAFAAVLCGALYCKIKGISLPFALDCGMVGGVFALGVGRIGCHLNGDDFGLPVPNQLNPAWWAVRFPNLEDGGLFRYPVQLEETAASFLFGGIGLLMFRRAFQRARITVSSEGSLFTGSSSSCGAVMLGRIAAWMGLLSAAHRYLNEIFRGDPRGLFPGTQISTSSGIALLIVVFCAVCLSLLRQHLRSHSNTGVSS